MAHSKAKAGSETPSTTGHPQVPVWLREAQRGTGRRSGGAPRRSQQATPPTPPRSAGRESWPPPGVRPPPAHRRHRRPSASSLVSGSSFSMASARSLGARPTCGPHRPAPQGARPSADGSHERPPGRRRATTQPRPVGSRATAPTKRGHHATDRRPEPRAWCTHRRSARRGQGAGPRARDRSLARRWAVANRRWSSRRRSPQPARRPRPWAPASLRRTGRNGPAARPDTTGTDTVRTANRRRPAGPRAAHGPIDPGAPPHEPARQVGPAVHRNVRIAPTCPTARVRRSLGRGARTLRRERAQEPAPVGGHVP